MENSVKYLPTLDGWRALAVLIVIAHHGKDAIADYSPFMSELLHTYGQLGVHIFFAISGYLITTLLLREAQSAEGIALRNFYIRRAFRILPAATTYIAVTACFALFGVIQWNELGWLGALLFFANYVREPGWYVAHFWSLSVEEHFYIVWPLAISSLRKKHLLKYSLLFALTASLWRSIDIYFQLSWHSGWPNPFGRTDTQIDGILYGSLVALIASTAQGNAYLNILFKGKRCLSLYGALFVALAAPGFKGWIIGITVTKICLALIVASTVKQPTSLFGKFLENQNLRFIGKLSFSLYLWQQLFFVWDPFASIKLFAVQHFPFNVLLTSVIAYLSYRLIEQPFLNLGKNFRGRASPTLD